MKLDSITVVILEKWLKTVLEFSAKISFLFVDETFVVCNCSFNHSVVILIFTNTLLLIQKEMIKVINVPLILG